MVSVYTNSAQSVTTLETLAAVKEVAKALMYELTGNDLSDQVNGQNLTDEVLDHLIAARQRMNLQMMTSGAI